MSDNVIVGEPVDLSEVLAEGRRIYVVEHDGELWIGNSYFMMRCNERVLALFRSWNLELLVGTLSPSADGGRPHRISEEVPTAASEPLAKIEPGRAILAPSQLPFAHLGNPVLTFAHGPYRDTYVLFHRFDSTEPVAVRQDYLAAISSETRRPLRYEQAAVRKEVAVWDEDRLVGVVMPYRTWGDEAS